LPGGAAAGRAGRVRRLDQIGEVRALDVMELQGSGDGFQHLFGDTAGVPAFQPGVVLD
jgi:hypothetical protein